MRESFPPGASQQPDPRHQRTQMMGTPEARSNRSHVIRDMDKYRKENPGVDEVLSQWERAQRQQAREGSVRDRLHRVQQAYTPPPTGHNARMEAGQVMHQPMQQGHRPVVYLEHNPFGRMQRASPDRQAWREELDGLRLQMEQLEESFRRFADSNGEKGASIDAWLVRRTKWQRGLAKTLNLSSATLDVYAQQYEALKKRERALEMRPGGDL